MQPFSRNHEFAKARLRSVCSEPIQKGRGGMRVLALLVGLAVCVASAAAPDEQALGKSRGYPVCPNSKGSFSPEWCLVGVTSHYHQVYPSRAVKKADSPRPLLRALKAPAVGIDAFLAQHRNTGLLVMQGDTIHAERYQYERNAEHRFASMSMAKTVVSMLVGIALQEKKIQSLDDKAEFYVPDLKGHPYGETPIRHLLTMTSGVKFDETYSGFDDVMKLATAILFQEGPGGGGGGAAVQRARRAAGAALELRFVRDLCSRARAPRRRGRRPLRVHVARPVAAHGCRVRCLLEYRSSGQ